MHMALLHPALARLIALQTRGNLRRMGRKCRNRRRAILTGLAALLACIWLGQAIAAIVLREPAHPDKFVAMAPWCMLGICLLKLARLFVNRDNAGTEFRRAEVELLLAGPFHRREVRAFKTAGHAVSVVVTALCASFFIWPDVPTWLGAFAGALSAMLFTYTLSMTLAIVIVHLPNAAYNVVRGLVGSALLLTAAYCAATPATGNWSQIHALDQLCTGMTRLGETWPIQIGLAPFSLISRVMTAETFFPGLLGWGTLAAMMVAATAWFLIWVEQSCYQRTVRKQQAAYAVDLADITSSALETPPDAATAAQPGPTAAQNARPAIKGRRRVPRLPWLRGAGPVAWRQLSGAWNNRLGILLLLLLFTAGTSLLLLGACDGRPGDGIRILLFLFIQSNLLLPALLPYDFRRDVDRLVALKTLPISPRAVAVGQLITPIAISCVCQLCVLLTLASVLPQLAGTLLVGALFLLPANAIIFGLENLVFLLYPYRLSEYDLQASLRRVVMLFAKLLALVLALVFACISALVVVLVAQKLKTAAGPLPWVAEHARFLLMTAWWVAVLALAATLLRMVAWAFRRFDVSTDSPA